MLSLVPRAWRGGLWESVPAFHALKLFLDEAEVKELAEKPARHYRLGAQQH
ncbi:hypothetical protein [Infirmifilum sp. NZ]|uniref:hypothetical protein n=1 Tax=Infirmifilum sp. NZ TaxID=2926850 RepID=UPI0027A4F891|nr:hypothetical protein [Infirmifilum sp. NZ]UNQ72829.1 hypothetical protein MOV14_06860 [Infirmifilum sp. NZ]